MSVAKHMSHVKWHLGRSSNSGITATVFGAYGFVGRYVVNRLARAGARIVVPYRGDDYDMKHLKPMGDLGQIVPYEMSIRSYEELETAIEGSNVVINLLGKPFETNRFNFDQINHAFPRVLGSLCTDLGVDRVVHFSALGASPSADSKWLRTKYAGEQALLEEFPDTTILRPATIIGNEDKFFNKMAEFMRFVPVMPLIHGPNAKQQPVYALDVAAAVQAVLMQPETAGRTIALAGPKTYTNAEIYEYVSKTIRRPNNAVAMPRMALELVGAAIEGLPKPAITRDQVRTYLSDLTAPDDLPGLRDLGIEPTPLEEVGLLYLKRFRPPGSQTVQELSKLPYSGQHL